ncbi:hypothetical protein CL652_01890 [bacterium]|nr:hypothetical protein [bacterium]|tara:strand:+ start:18177 stop:18395 length:219 start_codon:yes stop_codon:yes gene_type:complete
MNERKKTASKIAAKLKSLKKQRGLSQSDLCKKTGLAYHTIAKIENGSTSDPRVSSLKKLADVLEISVDEFLK